MRRIERCRRTAAGTRAALGQRSLAGELTQFAGELSDAESGNLRLVGETVATHHRDRSFEHEPDGYIARADLEHEAAHEADRELRGDLLRQLASRVTFDVPASLVDREIDRRVEEFVRRLVEQQIDPTRTNVNWEEFRERQRDAAAESVRSALVLDEIARRDGLAPSDAEIDAEIERYAERAGRTAAVVRARLEKEGGLARLYTGLRREKTMEFLLSKATVLKG